MLLKLVLLTALHGVVAWKKGGRCCKVCTVGKACGNSCVSTKWECSKGKGCACDGDTCAQFCINGKACGDKCIAYDEPCDPKTSKKPQRPVCAKDSYLCGNTCIKKKTPCTKICKTGKLCGNACIPNNRHCSLDGHGNAEEEANVEEEDDDDEKHVDEEDPEQEEVVTKSKQCKKGKPCGNTCIPKNRKCYDELFAYKQKCKANEKPCGAECIPKSKKCNLEQAPRMQEAMCDREVEKVTERGYGSMLKDAIKKGQVKKEQLATAVLSTVLPQDAMDMLNHVLGADTGNTRTASPATATKGKAKVKTKKNAKEDAKKEL